MRVLLTGGAGFIGSHTSRSLLAAGHEVTVVDNLFNGRRDLVPEGARFIEGDIADERLPQWLEGHDAVIHMAAFVPVPLSINNPVGYAENNVVNTVRLLEAMRTAGVNRIVFSSSATVYGTPARLPIREDDPVQMQSNPYGATKVAAEGFIAVYNRLYGMDATILRYFNPFGPNELCDPETHLVPIVVQRGLKDEPIPVYWGGEQVRDFIYVGDLAEAHTAVVPLGGFNIFNVGSETGTRVIDLISAVGTILGRQLKVEDRGERQGDVHAYYATSERLRQATGWSAKVSLEEGLRRTVEYYRDR
ncbi:MAG: NAD-dependent epimerase/dehydratase family protein [Dehalococcoidia bacterium]